VIYLAGKPYIKKLEHLTHDGRRRHPHGHRRGRRLRQARPVLARIIEMDDVIDDLLTS
jgi:hypothetical protein